MATSLRLLVYVPPHYYSHASNGIHKHNRKPHRPVPESLTTRATRHTLDTGATIPALGFGTSQDADAQEDAVSRCLKAGFHLIDTAQVYDVEVEVGKGMKKSGVPREDIFLATKLWCNTYHPDDVEAALDVSLRDLDTPYVDLLLMHYPCGKMVHGKTTYVDTWKALEKVLLTGKVNAIGVSNFSKGEYRLCSMNAKWYPPAVHQMETHPYLLQKSFNAWLQSKGIHVIQFSPLGNMNPFYRETGWSKDIAHTVERIIDSPLLKELGLKYNKMPVQMALAWGINSGRSVIPKSVIDWQIDQNIEADFEMAKDDMKRIGSMDRKARFNDPSADYRYRLYSDLEGIEGTVEGKTH
ncbi:putative oxidoreductase [Lachnellula subtilissima]|uniref:Putative oxidoreductase n=1 Tax=Lachnellula subtilissima TaxID=602034 RepID=A0A8H8RJD6_9HELO|nr:putative oxidoreductase [Lachnellula subtilissima]